MDNVTALLERLAPSAELVIYSAVIVVIGLFVATFAGNATGRLATRLQRHVNLSLEVRLALERVARFFIVVLMLIVLLNAWGLGIGGLWTAFAGLIAGLGVALIAVWAMASNITAAFFLAFWRPFSLGDTVEIMPENVKGAAIDRNLMFTLLRQDDGATIAIPNNLFFQRVFRSSAPKPPSVDSA